MGKQELLILVAPPASGKSRAALLLEKNFSYTRVNRDELGSMTACMSAARAALREGKSVVVDNLNMNKVSRRPWISLGNELGGPVVLRAIIVDIPKDVCLLLNRYRAVDPLTRKPDQRLVPTVRIRADFSLVLALNTVCRW